MAHHVIEIEYKKLMRTLCLFAHQVLDGGQRAIDLFAIQDAPQDASEGRSWQLSRSGATPESHFETLIFYKLSSRNLITQYDLC